jgi:SMC interacting uncharacterized protein involved in chromosome segregation
VPDRCKKRSGSVRYVHGQKEETTGTFRSRETNDKESIRVVSRKGKPLLPRQEGPKTSCLKQKDKHTSGSKEKLISKIKSLRKQVKRLQLERDVLKGTAEILKKDPGVGQKKLTNREKAILIGPLRKTIP